MNIDTMNALLDADAVKLIGLINRLEKTFQHLVEANNLGDEWMSEFYICVRDSLGLED